ncbi:MAG: FAD-dependent oxidoreductase [Deltaproteobacteria bacterium]|nr:FAD-dependent oxidoreductase [Deltaproteobacteria bacterium]
MHDVRQKIDILIVGAGMAGSAAASELKRTGHNVLVVDKGRGAGGRLASRRIGGATFDHGAQFMTARDPRFAAAMDQWQKNGVVEEWFRSSDERPESHSRWRGKPTMTAVARHLARNVEVLLEKRIVLLRRDTAGWVAQLESGETFRASAVLLTPPVPQSLAILKAGGSTLPPEKKARLDAIEYERCLAVLAVLDGPARIPPPGGLAPTEGPIAWIADNQRKGVSAAPAVTIHATAAFSLEHWDRDRKDCGRELLQAAEVWLGSAVTGFQVHGWRYSKPVRVEESPCLILSESPPLVLAGDAFAGPRVEGAALSGWAAADALKQRNRFGNS